MLTDQDRKIRNRYSRIVFGIALFGIYATSFHSFLLFHTLSELFSIIVAGSIFVIAWNGRRIIVNPYLLIIGIAFFFIGLLDLMHTLTYSGIGILTDEGGNRATQLWIAARYMESLTFLAAALFLNKKVHPDRIFLIYSLITSVLLLSIFYWDVFPDCFLPGTGLTPFKVRSEYLISVFFLLSLLLVVRYREKFDTDIAHLLIAAVLVTMISELVFTLYLHVYAPLNLIGHLFKLIAFYLLYRAIIETAFLKPFTLLFNEIRLREIQLQKSRDQLMRSYGHLKDQAHEQAIELVLTSAELKNTQLEKEQERKRFYFILENLPAFVYLLSEDFTIHYANHYFKKLFGNPVGQYCHNLLHGREAPCEKCGMPQVIETGQPLEWDWTDAPNNRKYHVYSFPFTDVDGKLMMLEMGVDITDRVAAESGIRQYARKLEIKNQELQDFAYVASHDLQEPLRKIVTFADLLRTDYGNQLDAKGTDYLLRMEKAAVRMRKLIKALLEYSRITSGEEFIVDVDLTRIAEKAIENLEDRIRQKNARILIEPLAVIKADASQMEQLFQNIISNAVKFNTHSQPAVTIRGRIAKHADSPEIDSLSDVAGAWYQILFEDNGIGIDEKYLDQIFIPFQRLHERHKFDGTGIGLSICQKIVERHGGKMTVKSHPGRGSIFIVTLPIDQEKI
jgi:hypothetical protein